MVRRGGLLLLALLMLPVASAGEASGEIDALGGVQLPTGTVMRFQPAIALHEFDLDGGQRVSSLTLTASRAVVHEYRWTAVEPNVLTLPTGSVMGRRDGDSYLLTNVTVELAGTRQDGHLGLYARPSSDATFVTSAPTSLEGRDRSTVFTSTPVGDEPRDTQNTVHYYYKDLQGAHLLWRAPGSFHLVGAAAVKAFGLDLRVESDEGARVVRTGLDRADGSPVDAVYRWAVVEFPEGVLHVQSTGVWTHAATNSGLGWSGMASFTAVEGEITSPEASYRSTGGPVTLDGEFVGTAAGLLRPDGHVLVRMALDGHIASTTLYREPASLAARVGASDWPPELLFALAFAVATGAGGFLGGAWFARRRAPAPAPAAAADETPFSAEDCCDAGAKAAAEEDWAAAAKWFRRAHALAPTSARICSDLAFSLSQIGEVEEALHLFEKASTLSSDGEADFNAALVLLQAHRPAEEVETWLERALDRTPGLALSMDEDDDFHPLRGRTRFESFMRRARDRATRRAGEGGPAPA